MAASAAAERSDFIGAVAGVTGPCKQFNGVSRAPLASADGRTMPRSSGGSVYSSSIAISDDASVSGVCPSKNDTNINNNNNNNNNTKTISNAP